jgi:16S rRNA (uracil1498-N3)-methyltransferase
MHRFFISSEQISDDRAYIKGSDVHHLKNVLRLQVGNEIQLCDGASRTFLAKISAISEDKATADIIKEMEQDKSSLPRVFLAQALPKGSKMEEVIEKCTQLGVDTIIPVASERTIVKLDEARSKTKIARWQKIAQSASEQSGRIKVTVIRPLITLKELTDEFKDYDLVLLPWELERDRGLKDILSGTTPKKILVIIGPEGGFSQTEADLARKAGAQTVTLGNTILRTETAGFAVLAMINYQFNPQPNPSPSGRRARDEGI